MTTTAVVRFPPFALDRAKRVLLRDGAPVTLTPKAFDMLSLLVARRDHVVSKDELLQELWPDAAVEEATVNQHVFMLRRALGDDPATPLFIATIPRRGFRFVGQIVEDNATETRSLTLRSTILPAIGIGALLVAIGVGVLSMRPRHRPLTDRDELLLADVSNSTGEPVFDGALWQALAVQLDQSPFLSVVSREHIRETLAYMKRPPDEPFVGAAAREVCQRMNVKAMLSGSIRRIGSQYVIALDAIGCQSGETLARDQVEVKSREEVLAGLGRMASRMRGSLGESVPSISRFDLPLTQASTASLDALKAFSAAEEERAEGREIEAIPLYKRAIELDPDFALAYGRLTAVYGNLGEWSRSAEYAAEAFARQTRVSERERFYIASGSYVVGQTADFEKYGETLALWAKAYPRDWYPLCAIADFFNTTGRYAKGLTPAQEALRLNPRSSLAYERVAETYEGLNDWAQAKAVLEAAVAAGRDSMGVHEHLFELALIDGDAPGMARQVSFAAGRIDEDEMLQGQADAAAFQGKLAESRALRLKAARAVEREGLHESAAIIYSDQAVIESLCGERQRTLEQVARVSSSAETTLALVNAAEALANIGEVQRAEQIRPAVPLGGWLQPGVTVTNAMLQIQRGDATGALATLEKSAIVDLGRYTALRPPFVRGLAYLALKDGAKAAAEFQKIRDHRGISPVSILYPLAHLQQARAYALVGEVESAQRTYESFFSLWQHADQNVSVLQHARREYAALSERHASEDVARIKPATRR